MNEEEKEDIELDIEAKYVDRTEKEFLSRVTYAECLYILTPENKYCGKIRELAVLKLCEIIDRLQKENEELNLKYYMLYTGKIENLKAQEVKIKSQVIPVKKVKDKMESYKKILKTCNKAKDVDRIKAINERILELQELLEGRK